MSARTPDDAAHIARAVGGLDRPEAVVFDSDGVLLDSGPAWRAARTELFERHGRTFGDDENREAVGTGVAGTGRLLSRLLDRPDRAGDLSEEFEVPLSAEMAKGVRPLPGALELVEELRGSVPIAVASNSPREILAAALEAAGLSDAFDVVVGVDEVSEAKPAPDLYLAASERLGIHPAQGVAVEDSPAGVAAARAAGLYVIGIPSLAGVALEADMTAASSRPSRRPREARRGRHYAAATGPVTVRGLRCDQRRVMFMRARPCDAGVPRRPGSCRTRGEPEPQEAGPDCQPDAGAAVLLCGRIAAAGLERRHTP